MSQGGGHGGTGPAATSRIGETREGREDSQGVCCICCMSLTAGRNLQSNVRAGNKRSGPVEGRRTSRTGHLDGFYHALFYPVPGVDGRKFSWQ